MTTGENFSGQTTPSIIDTEYRWCNFAQPQPVDVGGSVYEGVRIFPGDDTPRTFIECNLINAEVPPGSTVTGCNTAIIQRSLDGDVETVTIDGQSVNIQHYIDRVHGRWTSGGYEYHPSPIDIEVS